MDRRREEARWKRGQDQRDERENRSAFYSFSSEWADFNIQVKRTAALDIKECRHSREEITIGLSRLVGRQVSIAQIDAMLAESKPHRFPAEWIPAWVRVTGSKRLLDLLCAASGYWLADDVDVDLANMARAEILRDRHGSKASDLRARVERALR